MWHLSFCVKAINSKTSDSVTLSDTIQDFRYEMVKSYFVKKMEIRLKAQL